MATEERFANKRANMVSRDEEAVIRSRHTAHMAHYGATDADCEIG